MKESRIKYFKDLLEQERERLRESINRRTQRIIQLASYESGEHTYSNHPADSAILGSEREEEAKFQEREWKLLKEVEYALHRIKMNEYGICERCSKKISLERLKLLPYTRYCKTCEDEIEGQ